MEALLKNINRLYEQGHATEFEIRRFEREAMHFTSRPTTTAEGYMALGLLAALRVDEEASENHFRNSLRLAPHDPLILANHAKVQHALGHSKEALKSIGRAIEIADTESIIQQGVHISLSGLQIEQALLWQAKLSEPLMTLSEKWLNQHLTLLKEKGLTPMDLTDYRDTQAAVLTHVKALSDRATLMFEHSGQIRYLFLLSGSSEVSSEMINKQWQTQAQYPEHDIVRFFLSEC